MMLLITPACFYCYAVSFGEGNGTPLQCSCLENPRDRGAWWAAVYGVTRNWTRLKRVSSSSNIYYTPALVIYCCAKNLLQDLGV